MPDTNLKVLTRKNLLNAIEKSAGTKLFQNLYVRNKTTGEINDVLGGGDLSCAVFVSSLLTLNGLIDRPHATTKTTLEKMKESGWVETDKPTPGCVVHWPLVDQNDHLGFVLDEKRCVSNDKDALTPQIHDYMHKGKKPIAYYTHKILTD